MKSKFLKSMVVALSVSIALAGVPFSASAAETNTSVSESAVKAVATGNSATGEIVNAPQITRFENTADGTKISWTKYKGAAKYRIFIYNGSGWKCVGNSTTLSYTHSPLVNGKSYIYTVRAMDSNNNYISSYFKQGYKNTFYAPPVISSLTNSDSGVSIKWGKISGIENYRVYKKTNGSSWKCIGDANGTSYTDKNVTAGISYTYTVRCLDANGKLVSYFNQGKSITYVKVPTITKIENTATGAKITWTKSAGAAKYRVYYLDSNNAWKALGTTTLTSFTHNNLKTGTTYTYTVRCLDSKGSFASSYNKAGTSNMFITTPKISSLTGTNDGVVVKWGKLKGAEGYRVYRKTNSSGWKCIGDANGTSYTDKNVVAGNKYSYTVRCLDKNGKLISYFNQGKSITYAKAPSITKFENTATGTKITWSKSVGAAKYRVYYLNSNNQWKSLCTTTSTSFTHDKLKTGTTYTYTVRCLDSNGNYVSGYSKTGKSNMFLEPPVISSVTRINKGNLIEWETVKGAAGYRLYRKTIGTSWTKIADITSGNSYVDTSAKAGNVYTYTLRCLDKNGKLVSYYISDSYSYEYNKAYADEVIRLVNIEREKYGLSALAKNTGATKAAETRSKEITQLFSHTRPDGTPFYSITNEFNLSYGTIGENVAYGYPSPESVVEGWMNSQGHRANILTGAFNGIGVGCYESNGVLYWVQIFIGV